jgi:hypothetical protein
MAADIYNELLHPSDRLSNASTTGSTPGSSMPRQQAKQGSLQRSAELDEAALAGDIYLELAEPAFGPGLQRSPQRQTVRQQQQQGAWSQAGSEAGLASEIYRELAAPEPVPGPSTSTGYPCQHRVYASQALGLHGKRAAAEPPATSHRRHHPAAQNPAAHSGTTPAMSPRSRLSHTTRQDPPPPTYDNLAHHWPSSSNSTHAGPLPSHPPASPRMQRSGSRHTGSPSIDPSALRRHSLDSIGSMADHWPDNVSISGLSSVSHEHVVDTPAAAADRRAWHSPPAVVSHVGAQAGWTQQQQQQQEPGSSPRQLSWGFFRQRSVASLGQGTQQDMPRAARSGRARRGSFAFVAPEETMGQQEQQQVLHEGQQAAAAHTRTPASGSSAVLLGRTGKQSLGQSSGGSQGSPTSWPVPPPGGFRLRSTSLGQRVTEAAAHTAPGADGSPGAQPDDDNGSATATVPDGLPLVAGAGASSRLAAAAQSLPAAAAAATAAAPIGSEEEALAAAVAAGSAAQQPAASPAARTAAEDEAEEEELAAVVAADVMGGPGRLPHTPFALHAGSVSTGHTAHHGHSDAELSPVHHIKPLAMPDCHLSRRHSLESFASGNTYSTHATNTTAVTEARRRRLRRVPSYNHSISTVLSIVSGTTSIFLPPKPQGTQYEQHIGARPSFELRKLPPSNYFFQALNVVMVAALMAAAVVDYYYKTGRIG